LDLKGRAPPVRPCRECGLRVDLGGKYSGTDNRRADFVCLFDVGLKYSGCHRDQIKVRNLFFRKLAGKQRFARLHV
jgi:hypothetical protein